MDYSKFAVVPRGQVNEPVCRHRGFVEESGDGCYSHPPQRKLQIPRTKFQGGVWFLEIGSWFCLVFLSPKPDRNGNPLILPEPKGSQFMYKVKVMLSCALGSLVLMLVAALPALAAEEKAAAGTPQAHVVLVGISDYADKQIKPRKFAEEDAQALYDLLPDKRYLGVKGNNSLLLVGCADETRHSHPTTRANIV